MLTSAEQRQIQEERFLQLAYHARTKLILARYEKDEKGRRNRGKQSCDI